MIIAWSALWLFSWLKEVDPLCSPTSYYRNCWIRRFPGLSIAVEESRRRGATLLELYQEESALKCSRACCLTTNFSCNLAVYHYNTTQDSANCFHFHCPTLESCILHQKSNVILYNVTKGVDPDLLVFGKHFTSNFRVLPNHASSRLNISEPVASDKRQFNRPHAAPRSSTYPATPTTSTNTSTLSEVPDSTPPVSLYSAQDVPSETSIPRSTLKSTTQPSSTQVAANHITYPTSTASTKWPSTAQQSSVQPSPVSYMSQTAVQAFSSQPILSTNRHTTAHNTASTTSENTLQSTTASTTIQTILASAGVSITSQNKLESTAASTTSQNTLESTRISTTSQNTLESTTASTTSQNALESTTASTTSQNTLESTTASTTSQNTLESTTASTTSQNTQESTTASTTSQNTLESTTASTTSQNTLESTTASTTSQNTLESTTASITSQNTLESARISITSQNTLESTTASTTSQNTLESTTASTTSQNTLESTTASTTSQNTLESARISITSQNTLESTTASTTSQNTLESTTASTTSQNTLESTTASTTSQNTLESTTASTTSQNTLESTTASATSQNTSTNSDINTLTDSSRSTKFNSKPPTTRTSSFIDTQHTTTVHSTTLPSNSHTAVKTQHMTTQPQISRSQATVSWPYSQPTNTLSESPLAEESTTQARATDGQVYTSTDETTTDGSKASTRPPSHAEHTVTTSLTAPTSMEDSLPYPNDTKGYISRNITTGDSLLPGGDGLTPGWHLAANTVLVALATCATVVFGCCCSVLMAVSWRGRRRRKGRYRTTLSGKRGSMRLIKYVIVRESS